MLHVSAATGTGTLQIEAGLLGKRICKWKASGTHALARRRRGVDGLTAAEARLALAERHHTEPARPGGRRRDGKARIWKLFPPRLPLEISLRGQAYTNTRLHAGSVPGRRAVLVSDRSTNSHRTRPTVRERDWAGRR